MADYSFMRIFIQATFLWIMATNNPCFASQEQAKAMDIDMDLSPNHSTTIANINATNSRGETALLAAAGSGDEEMTTLLLQFGADPNKADNRGRTPLHWATMGNFTTIIKTLLRYEKTEIDAQDHTGKTALIYASEIQNTKPLEVLLENGADHTAQDLNGKVALMHAVDWRNSKACELLENSLSYTKYSDDGSPVILSDNCGLSVEKYLKFAKNIENQRKEKEKKQIAELQADTRTSSLNITPQFFYDALIKDDIAKAKAYLTTVNTHLDASKLEFVPLHSVAARGYLPMVDLLLSHKVDINEQNNTGDTALMRAISDNYEIKDKTRLDMTFLLLRRGANSTIKNKKGETAYTLAIQCAQEVRTLAKQHREMAKQYTETDKKLAEQHTEMAYTFDQISNLVKKYEAKQKETQEKK